MKTSRYPFSVASLAKASCHLCTLFISSCGSPTAIHCEHNYMCFGLTIQDADVCELFVKSTQNLAGCRRGLVSSSLKGKIIRSEARKQRKVFVIKLAATTQDNMNNP